MCEHASNTLGHINRVKIFTENSAMARLGQVGGQLTPKYTQARLIVIVNQIAPLTMTTAKPGFRGSC